MSKFNFRRSKSFWTIVLVSVFCLMVILLAVPAQAGPTVVVPLLWLNPTNPVANVGGNVDVDIQLDDITDVYSAEVKLSFDPAVLKVTGDTLAPGTCPDPTYIISNTADNTLGTIEYGVYQRNPMLPCNGGVMATINFECLAEGTSTVAFDSSEILTQDADPIAHNRQSGTVECQEAVIDIIGTVALQLWPDPSGVAVTLYDSGGVADGPVIVGPNGEFQLHATDETETYRVMAEYDRYLTAEASNISGTGGYVIDLGLTTLRAGDLNGDGVISLADLTALAGNYTKTSPQVWAP